MHIILLDPYFPMDTIHANGRWLMDLDLCDFSFFLPRDQYFVASILVLRILSFPLSNLFLTSCFPVNAIPTRLFNPIYRFG